MGNGLYCKCEKCLYTLRFTQGVGMLYQIEAEKILTKMKRGEFGERFMEEANNAVVPRIRFSHELYRCNDCGELRPDMQIELLDSNKVVLSNEHVCAKCHGQMSIVNSDDDLKCPNCKSKLGVELVFLWD